MWKTMGVWVKFVTPKPWGHSYQVSKVDLYPTPQDIWLYIWSNHLISGSWICRWILSFHQHTFENTTESQTCNETSIKCGIMWNNVETNQHTTINKIGIPGIPQWDITATVTSLGWAAWLVRLQGVSSSMVSRRHHQPQQLPWLRKKRAKNAG